MGGSTFRLSFQTFNLKLAFIISRMTGDDIPLFEKQSQSHFGRHLILLKIQVYSILMKCWIGNYAIPIIIVYSTKSMGVFCQYKDFPVEKHSFDIKGFKLSIVRKDTVNWHLYIQTIDNSRQWATSSRIHYFMGMTQLRIPQVYAGKTIAC